MKKTSCVFYILTVLAVLCCAGFAFSASAADEYVEGAFTYTVTNGEATIVSFDESSYVGHPYEVEFPSEIGSYPVVAVEDNHFSQDNYIRGAIYPDSVKRIYFPFFNVNNYTLRRVVIYNKDCDVSYTPSVPSISEEYDTIIWGYKGSTAEAFARKHNKGFVDLDSVKQEGIFSYYMDNDEAKILWVPNDTVGEITIPSHIQGFPVTKIEDSAFIKTNITSAIIPKSVTQIGNQAFFFSKLRNVTFSEGLRIIGDRAFGTSRITSIKLPDSLEIIGNNAFNNTNLKQILIPSNVNKIGNNVFGYCKSLESIFVDENNDYFSNDERGVLFDKNKNVLIQFPIGNKSSNEYTAPETVEAIEAYAFYFSTGLEFVKLPETMKRIGTCAFAYSGLAEISFPDGLEMIGERAFDSTYLQDVIIPESVTQLSARAFDRCKQLRCFISYSFNSNINMLPQTISDTATIYGYPNSTAQIYAETNKRKFVLLESADSYESLVEYVRRQMINRNKYIIVSYPQGAPALTSNNDFVKFFDAVFAYDKADSAAGDTLRWSVKKVNRAVLDDGYLVLDVDYYTTAEQESLLNEKLLEIAESLRLNDQPEYEKARLIFEYLCDNANAVSPNDKTYSNVHHFAYSVLVNNSGVCEGFSLAFYRLALEAGLDARVVVNDKLLNACNIVRIADKWYYLDTYLAADEDDSARGDAFYFLKSSVESQFIWEEYITFTPAYETEENWALTPIEIKDYNFAESDYIVDGGCSHIMNFVGYSGQPCSGMGKEEYKCPKCGNEFSRNCKIEHTALPGLTNCQWCNKIICKHQ